MEQIKGALIVALLPTDSSTEWFHQYVWNRRNHDFHKNVKVRFPAKRLKFDNENSAKFASMIVVFTRNE